MVVAARPGRRRGLAPLELVLSLPLVLFVMGLIIIIGTAGAWKVRTHTVAREALWRTLAPRNASLPFNPPNWPGTGEYGHDASAEALVPEDPLAHHAVVRGPVLVDPKTGNALPVEDRLMAIHEGTKSGFARLERGFPVLGRVPPHGFEFFREPVVFDRTQWRFWEMGLHSNLSHRVPAIYPFDFQAVGGDLAQRYAQLATALVISARDPSLDVLDREPDFINIRGMAAPDFHPRVPVESVCSADPDFLQEFVVEPLIIRISGGIPRVPGQGDVAETMGHSFLSLYEYVKQVVETPGSPPSEVRRLLSICPDYQAKIDALEAFLDRIGS